MNITGDSISAREIISTRAFPVSRETMWAAWSNPEILARWWGPKGFSNTFHEFDFRPGGFWRFIMHGPDGTDYKNESLFVETAKPERIVFKHLSNPKFQVTAAFAGAVGNAGKQKTRVTFRMLFETAAACDAVKHICIPSNEENFDRLEAVLEKMQAAR